MAGLGTAGSRARTTDAAGRGAEVRAGAALAFLDQSPEPRRSDETVSASRRRPEASPFSKGSWVRVWLATATVGLSFLAVIFVGYEIAERLVLKDRFSTNSLFRFHVLRGLSASVVLASWAFYSIWRTRRRYDQAFREAYAQLEKDMDDRSLDLARAQAFTERLFDALRDRIVVANERGIVVKANRVATESAGGVENLIGKPCSTLSLGCSFSDDECIGRKAFKTGLPVVGECIRTDPRTGLIYKVDAYPVPDTDGRPSVVIESGRDITAEKQLEAQIRHQEKMAALGLLAAGIAHDIGNPLASLSSEIDMLEVESDPGKGRRSLHVLRSQVGRIARTLREMTDFARRRGEDVTAVSVNTAVEDALRMVGHDPRTRTVKVVADLSDDLPQIQMVEDHLVLVLVNLLVNAYDALPGGGTVTIRTRRAGGTIGIEVCDTGFGMTGDVLRRAKEPLFTTKARGRGTGLGLSVCVDVMRSVGGKLGIDSVPGNGTTVRLEIPAAGGGAGKTGASEKAVAGGAGARA